MDIPAVKIIKKAWRASIARLLTGVYTGLSEKRYLNGRRRANSTTTDNSRGTSPRPSTARSGHSRASSEFSATLLLKDHPQTSQSHGSTSQGRLPRPSHGGQMSQLSIPVDSLPHVTVTTTSPMIEAVSVTPLMPPSGGHEYSSPLPVGKARDSFLDMDDDSIKDPDEIPILAREGSMLDDDDQQEAADDEDQKPARAIGFTWDELVDRLLQEKMSKSDSNFVTVFLCFYRKIAPPKELLKSILHKFESAKTDKILLARINNQSRYCVILNQWVKDHPGDFAHPKTRQKFTTFLNSLSNNRTFALLAREMQHHLLNTIDDEDAMWGKADGDKEGDAGSCHSSTANTFQDPPKASGSEGRVPERQVLSIYPNDLQRRPSEVPNLISITPGGSLIREQYTQFMETLDEDIANELTRIDWAEFSQIRPRDLVRHVSTSPDQRDRCKSLVHVSRMISHFNHVAFWVSNIILERPKAKHRARALEKFMEIAWVI